MLAGITQMLQVNKKNQERYQSSAVSEVKVCFLTKMTRELSAGKAGTKRLVEERSRDWQGAQWRKPGQSRCSNRVRAGFLPAEAGAFSLSGVGVC